MKLNKKLILVGIVIICVAGAFAFWFTNKDTIKPVDFSQQPVESNNIVADVKRQSPLKNKKFYVDQQRSVVESVNTFKSYRDTESALLLSKIAEQPGTAWLIGPNESDPFANRDIAEVARTTNAAVETGTVPIYQLYAIPQRDACAEYSKGGFDTSAEYLKWLDRIISELKTPSVFSVEADAIGHSIRVDCLGQNQISERYKLLDSTMTKLSESPNVLAAYLDAAHSEWFPDPTMMVEPLIKSGVKKGDGVVVNVSNFIATPDITKWSQNLVKALDADLGVVIDTSRNGKGSPDSSVKGDARWCNPAKRGLGMRPSGDVDAEYIDAYLWIKVPGESDGACFGNPKAGVFSPALALELARNSAE